MKTTIYPSYLAFLARVDQDENGVSKSHAAANPGYSPDNSSNLACWNCSRCSDCSGCSRCSDCSGCSRCSDCSDCSGCSRCSDCSDCSGCSGCSDCSRCSDCSDCSGCSGCSGCSRCSDCSDCSGCSDCSDCSDITPQQQSKIATPEQAIENLDKVRAIILDNQKRLFMGHWHDDDSDWQAHTCAEEAACETTHCLAGWLQVCSTDPEVRKMEAQTAGFMCAPIACGMFFQTDERVLQWLEARDYVKALDDRKVQP